MASMRELEKFVKKGNRSTRKMPLKAGSWLANASKSVGYSSLDILKNLMPNSIEMGQSAVETAGEIRDALKDASSKGDQFRQSFDANDYIRLGKEGLKNALEDLKSGDFYNDRRYQAYVDKSMTLDDDDSFDFGEDFDFSDGDEDFDIDLTSDDEGASVSMKRSHKGRKEATHITMISNIGPDSPIVEATKFQTQVAVKGVNVLVDAGVANTQATMTLMSKIGSDQLKLANLTHQTIVDMSDAIQKEFSQFNTISEKYYNDSMEQLTKIAGSLEDIKQNTAVGAGAMAAKSPKDVPDMLDLFSGGTINISEYKRYVQRNFNNWVDSSFIASQIKGIFEDKDTLGSIMAAPLRFLTEGIAKQMIPNVVQTAMQQFDEMVGEALVTKLTQWGSMSESTNPFLQAIGEIFGLRTKQQTSIDKSKYEKGPVPFDGVTHRTINDVIPTYLRQIASAVTGQEEKVFDYDRGEFRTLRDVRENYDRDIKRQKLAPMSEDIDEFSQMVKDTFTGATKEQLTSLTDEFQRVLSTIISKGGITGYKRVYDKNGNITKDPLRDVVEEAGGDARMIDLIRAFLDSREEVGEGYKNARMFGRSIHESRNNINRMMAEMEANPIRYNAQYVQNGLQGNETMVVPKDSRGKVRVNQSVGPLADQYGKQSTWYQREILKILAGGVINARIIGGGKRRGGSGPVGEGPTTVGGDSLEKLLKEESDYKAELRKETAEHEISEERRQKDLEEGKFDVWDDVGEEQLRLAASRSAQKRVEEAGGERKKSILEYIAGKGGTIGKWANQLNQFIGSGAGGIQSFFQGANSAVYTFLFGNEKGHKGFSALWDVVLNTVKGGLRKFGAFIDEKILAPLDKHLFGEDGIFTRLKETEFFKDLKERFGDLKKRAGEALFGEKVTNPDGSSYRTGGFINNTMEELKNGVRGLGDRLSAKLDSMKTSSGGFGEGDQTAEEKAQEEDQKELTKVRKTLSQRLSDGVDEIWGYTKSRVSGWADMLFGKPSEGDTVENGRDLIDNFKTEMKGKSGKIGAGAVVGAIATPILSSQLGILGSVFLPGGPIGGALLGAGVAFIRNSDTLKNLLFGEELTDEKGNKQGRAGGIITKEFQQFFKDHGLPMAIGGGLGLLPSMFIPGGPIGGALIGGALGFAKKMGIFNTILYGPDGDKENPTGGLMKRFENIFGKDTDFKTLAKQGLFGAGVGVIGSMFLPGGPITGAVLGSAASIVAHSEGFKRLLFGKEDEETGKRKGGLFGKFKGFLDTKFLLPIAKAAEMAQARFVFWMKDKIFLPVASALAPVVNKVGELGETIANGVKGLFRRIGDLFVEHTISPMKKAIHKWIISPLAKLSKRIFGGLFKLVTKVIGTAISLPFQAFGLVGDLIFSGDKRRGAIRGVMDSMKGVGAAARQGFQEGGIRGALTSGAGQVGTALSKFGDTMAQYSPKGAGMYANENWNPKKFRQELHAKNLAEFNAEKARIESKYASGRPDQKAKLMKSGKKEDAQTVELMDQTEHLADISISVDETKEEVTKVSDAVKESDTNNISMLDRLIEKITNGFDRIIAKLDNRGGASETANIVSDAVTTVADAVTGGMGDGNDPQLDKIISILEKIQGDVSKIKIFSRGSAMSEHATQVSENSAENIKAKFEKEDKEDAQTKAQNKTNETLTEIAEGQKSHNKLWSSIFSKKGLITAAVLGVGAFFISGGFRKLLGKAVEWLGNTIGGLIQDAINGLKNHFTDPLNNDGNHYQTDENNNLVLDENGQPIVVDEGNANIVDLFAPETTRIDVNTGEAKTQRELGRLAEPTVNAFRGRVIKPVVKKGMELTGKVRRNMPKIAATASYMADTVSLKMHTAATKVQGAASTVSKYAQEFGVTEKAGQLAESAKAVVGKTKTKIASNPIVSKFIGLAKQAIDFVVEKVTKFIGQNGGKANKVVAFIKKAWDVIDEKVLGKYIPQITKVIGKTATAAATLATSDVLWSSLAFINTNPAQIFQVRAEDVDVTMQLIARFFRGLMSTSFMSYYDLIAAIAGGILGFDYNSEICILIYNAIAGEGKSEELNEAQARFDEDWKAYNEQEYEAYVENCNASGQTPMDRETFDKTMATSKADYNANTNKTLGKKLFDGASGVVAGAKRFVGNTATKVKNAGAKAVTTVKNLGSAAIGKVTDFGSSVLNKGKELGGQALDFMKGIGSGIMEVISPFIDSAKEIGGTVVKTLENQIKAALSGKMSNFDTINVGNDDPLGPIKKAAIIGTRVMTMLPSLALMLGAKLVNGLKTVATGAVNLGKTVGGVITNNISQALTGEIPTKDFSPDTSSPINNIGKFVDGASAVALTPVALIVRLGKNLIDGAKNVFSIVGTTGSSVATSVSNNLQQALRGENPTKDYADDGSNPLAGVVQFFDGVSATVLTPVAGVVRLGKSLIEGAKGIFNTAKNVGTNIASCVGDNLSQALKGEFPTKDYTPAEDDPLSSIVTFIDGASATMLTPVAGVVKGVKLVIDGVKTLFSGIKNIGKNIATSVDVFNDKVNMDNYFKPTFETDSIGGMISNVIFTVIRGVMFPLFALKYSFNTIVGKLADAGNWLLETLGFGKSYDDTESSTDGGNGGFGGGVPYYSQNDPSIANKPYKLSNGKFDTMGNRGCGPTAMAMAMGGMGKAISPMSMAKDATEGGFSTNVGTTPGFFSHEANKLGVSATQTKASPSTISAGLSTGNPVIIQGASSDPNSPFTSRGHYVVGTGMSGSKVSIQDPRGPQYNKTYDVRQVTSGASNMWAFNQGGMGGFGGGPRSITVYGGFGTSAVTPESVVKIAQQEVGYLEKQSNSQLEDKTANAGDNNYTKYGVLTNTNGQYWCASFVCWVFHQACGGDSARRTEVLCGPMSAGCDELMANFKKCGRFDKNPQVGDIIMYGVPGDANHTGIVVGVGNGSITTIEGNTSAGSAVVRNGGGVAMKTVSLAEPRILGFCHPKYEGQTNFAGINTVDNSGTTSISGGTYSSNTFNTNSSSNSQDTSLSGLFTRFSSAITNPIMETFGLSGNNDNNTFNTTDSTTDVANATSIGSVDIGDDYVGKHVKQFESGDRGSAMISTGKGDNGGVSFGTYQFPSYRRSVAESDSNLARFWNTYYASAYPGVKPGDNQAFKDAWKDAATKDPKGFFGNEYAFVFPSYYASARDMFARNGLGNYDNYDRAAQEALWSSAVQLGVGSVKENNGAYGMFKRAGVNTSMDPKEFINKLYATKIERIPYSFKKSPSMQPGIRSRYEKEREILLGLAGQKPVDNTKYNGTSGGSGGFGGDVPTVNANSLRDMNLNQPRGNDGGFGNDEIFAKMLSVLETIADAVIGTRHASEDLLNKDFGYGAVVDNSTTNNSYNNLNQKTTSEGRKLLPGKDRSGYALAKQVAKGTFSLA